MRIAILIIASLLFINQLSAQTTEAGYMFAPDAEKVEMTGKVVSTFYAAQKSGKPVFINLDEEFPNNKVSVIIYQEYRQNFPNMMELEGKRILIKGKLHTPENGKPFIVLKHPAQLQIITEEMP